MRKINHLKQKTKPSLHHTTKRPFDPLKSLNKSQSVNLLSSSFASVKSNSSCKSNGIKLPSSFYNDRKGVYLNKSRQLSESSILYKRKNISFSERKRFEKQQIEHVHKRRINSQRDDLKDQKTASEIMLDKFRKKYKSFSTDKYQKLVYRQKIVKTNQVILDKQVKNMNSKRQNPKKWSSPFLSGNTSKQLFKGKPLVAKSIQKIYGNEDQSQLKVLNLDRIFRVREGKLTNIVPIPMPKMSEATTRKNLHKILTNKDKIHEVIQQFNKLIKINLFKKTTRLKVKGNNFTKNPTLQQLMGLKIKPLKSQEQDSQDRADQQTFIAHSQHYRSIIKKDVHLTRRIIAGLKQNDNLQGISLTSFTRFYLLFVNRTASINQKAQFLVYFFVPQGQQKIEFSVLKLILQLMCEQLPSIEKLDMKTDLLSKEQKSKIFLEALHRVLFSDIKDEMQRAEGLSRKLLRVILLSNNEASDLLIKLLQIQ